VHDFELRSLRGDPLPLRSFRGKALLIVNTASACGLTPQFEGLQRLHDKFSPSGFAVLGVPCDQFFRQEKGDEASIEEGVCKRFKVSFPMAAKVNVNGDGAHPMYKWLRAACPAASRPGGGEVRQGGLLRLLAPLSAWMAGTPLAEVGRIEHNFAKFLCDREGRIVRRFLPPTTPGELERDVEALLAAAAKQ
jgi:glutathione peroxidase